MPAKFSIQSFFLSNLNARYTDNIALINKATAIPIDGTNNAHIVHKIDTNATISINVLSLIVQNEFVVICIYA